MLALCQHPAERQLRRRHALARGQRRKRLGQPKVMRPVVALEARHVRADIALGHGCRIGPLIHEQPAADGRERNESDPQLAAHIQHRDFRIARHRRIFGLQRGDGVFGVGAAHRLGGHFGEADPADLALAHQISERADGFLDRHREIAAVEIIEVDVVGLEQLQRGFERAPDRFRLAVNPPRLAVDDDAGLACKEETVALARKRLADQRLVVAIAIDARRIKVIVAKVERAGEEAAAILVARRSAIGPTQRHAAKADGIGLTTGNRAAGKGHRSAPFRKERCQPGRRFVNPAGRGFCCSGRSKAAPARSPARPPTRVPWMGGRAGERAGAAPVSAKLKQPNHWP